MLTVARTSHGFLRSRNGAAAVEFALVAPILILLFMGMIGLLVEALRRVAVENRAAADVSHAPGEQNRLLVSTTPKPIA